MTSSFGFQRPLAHLDPAQQRCRLGGHLLEARSLSVQLGRHCSSPSIYHPQQGLVSCLFFVFFFFVKKNPQQKNPKLGMPSISASFGNTLGQPKKTILSMSCLPRCSWTGDEGGQEECGVSSPPRSSTSGPSSLCEDNLQASHARCPASKSPCKDTEEKKLQPSTQDGSWWQSVSASSRASRMQTLKDFELYLQMAVQWWWQVTQGGTLSGDSGLGLQSPQGPGLRVGWRSNGDQLAIILRSVSGGGGVGKN